ncbi:MAG: hypothetical protein NTY72_13220, partial [Bacteroidetes bacterium]|nr:hypothetical protein [Bacteroidota bacterium]
MRSILVYLILAIQLLSCKKDTTPETPIAPPVPVIAQYELAWQDDFNGTQLNMLDWSHRYPGVRHDGYNDTTTVSTDGAGNLVLKVYS